MLYFTILWALFAGIGDPFLALTVKKPKENQCFWLRTLKNLRKMNVFALPKHLVRGSRETPERLQRGSKTPERHQRDTREAAERQQDTRETA